MSQTPASASRRITVAAVQPALTLGTVGENLTRIERLIRDAVSRHRPDVVMIPESATTPNVYARVLRTTVQPVDGEPMRLLRDLARELDVIVGGGFVARRGADAYGTFVLAEPDGAAHLHNKDIPTMWENNYYTGDDHPGLTTLGTLGDVPVGMASGWEWARMGTARRLRGRVEILLGGMCWPSYPVNWRGPFGVLATREHALQRQHARELPRQVARLIGAPVVHASHVGPVSFDTPLAPGVAWRTEMVGETQIVERDGTILSRLSLEDGEGHIAATVTLDAPEPVDPLAPTYWIPPLSVTTRAAWRAMNAHGALKYRVLRAARRHPWQSRRAADLPDEIAPSQLAETQP